MKFSTTFTFAILAVCAMARPPSHAQVDSDIILKYNINGHHYDYEELTSGECYPVENPGWVEAGSASSSPSGAYCYLFETSECDFGGTYESVPNANGIYLESFKCILPETARKAPLVTKFRPAKVFFKKVFNVVNGLDG